MKTRVAWFGVLVSLTAAAPASAVTSAEIYTSAAYQYGRYSARIQFAPGSGVVSSFFLWKDGSEVAGVFWNELDFEKLEAECVMETNTIFDGPVQLDTERHALAGDLCGEYHVYTYEWTPEYIAWFYDGVEIRRETGERAAAYANNTAQGMQLRFNVWPGDEDFGGAFNPAILPVYQYIDWVEYSSYSDGAFNLEWREDFTSETIPAGWLTASWESPKQFSTHSPANVVIRDGYVVWALTNDDATGIGDADPRATDTQEPGPTPTPNPQPDPTEPVPSSTISQPAPTPSGPDGTDTDPPANGNPEPTPSEPVPPAPISTGTGPGPAPAPVVSASGTPVEETTAPPPNSTDLVTSAPGAISEPTAGDTSGCSCRVGSPVARGSGAGALGLLMLAALGYRRRREDTNAVRHRREFTNPGSSDRAAGRVDSNS